MSDLSLVQLRRNRVGVLARTKPGSLELTDARRDLAAEKIAAHIAKVVADAPPLTAEQRDRLAVLLRGGGRIA